MQLNFCNQLFKRQLTSQRINRVLTVINVQH